MTVESLFVRDCPNILHLKIDSYNRLGSKVEFVGANNVERLIMTGKLFLATSKKIKEFEGFNFDSLREVVLAESINKETLNWVQVLHWRKEGQTQIYGMDQN